LGRPRRIAIVVAEAIVKKSQPAAKTHPTVREVLMGHMAADMAAGVQCAGGSEMRARNGTATEPATQASDMAHATAAEAHAAAAEMSDPAATEAASTEPTAAEMAATKPATAEMAAAAAEPTTMAAAAEPASTPVPAAATTTATARQRRGCDRGTGESDRGDRSEYDIARH
jgi:hypothetical protein